MLNRLFQYSCSAEAVTLSRFKKKKPFWNDLQLQNWQNQEIQQGGGNIVGDHDECDFEMGCW